MLHEFRPGLWLAPQHILMIQKFLDHYAMNYAGEPLKLSLEDGELIEKALNEVKQTARKMMNDTSGQRIAPVSMPIIT